MITLERVIRRRLLVVFVPLVFACKPKHEGDVPLHVTNAPKCAAGHAMTKQVVVRMENGSDFVQQSLDDHMQGVNTWAGRKATVKVGLCEIGPCPSPAWVRSHDTTVRGDDKGLDVDLPHLEVPCDDGSMATN